MIYIGFLYRTGAGCVTASGHCCDRPTTAHSCWTDAYAISTISTSTTSITLSFAALSANGESNFCQLYEFTECYLCDVSCICLFAGKNVPGAATTANPISGSNTAIDYTVAWSATSTISSRTAALARWRRTACIRSRPSTAFPCDVSSDSSAATRPQLLSGCTNTTSRSTISTDNAAFASDAVEIKIRASHPQLNPFETKTTATFKKQTNLIAVCV